MKAVVIAGGTGGAKLARGLADVCGSDLTVIANTGDDIVIHDAHVSPDPDLCLYWLADIIDERGWGIDRDTFIAMDALRAQGEDVWFNLGDRDLAICRERRERLDDGASLTECLLDLRDRLGVDPTVLPMSDDPIQTEILSAGRTIGLQEFLIKERGSAPIEDIRYTGADRAAPTSEVLRAIAEADTIIIGPSNPVLSIGPVLAIAALKHAIESASAQVVAVSPIVDGAVLKGPTAACMAWAGSSVNASGIASHYGALLDGLISDESDAHLPVPHHICETDLSSTELRHDVALSVLAFATELR